MPTLAIILVITVHFHFPQHYSVNTPKFFFAERVVEPWNSIPATVQKFSSLRVFKTFLETFDFSTFSTVSLTN